MKTKEELLEFARLCSKSLSDDKELHQEVESELLDHLEEAFNEEQQKGSEEEALKTAFRRFGNPEEISAQLAEGNATRLSRHARIRRVMKWLVVPLLIFGVALCIDVRGILATSLVLKTAFSPKFNAKRYQNACPRLKTRELTPSERLLFDFYYQSERSLEFAEKLYTADSDNAMHCALYAQALATSDKSASDRLAMLNPVLENGRRIDVGNPLYDYIEAYLMMTDASDLSASSSTAIKDYDRFESAVEIYRRALSKGVVRTHGCELSSQVRGMLVTRRDLLGGMQLLDFEWRERLPYLQVLNGISKRLPLFCERLHENGDDKRAVELLRTWRVFIRQFVDGNHKHEIDLLACVKSAECFMNSSKTLNATEEIAALQRVVAWKRELVDSMKGSTDRLNNGGLMSHFVIFGTAADKSAYKVERKLEAATFDVAALGLACVAILVIVIIFGAITFYMRMGGRRPFLFIMPKDTYKRLLLYGILLPAVAYLLLSWFAGGRGGPSGMLWQLVSFVFLCLIWPLSFGIQCNRAIAQRLRGICATDLAVFKASRPLNMMCMFVILLFAVGGIMRPVQSIRQQCYARQESLIFPWTETNAQDKQLQKLQDRLLQLLR